MPMEEDPLWYKDAIIYELHVKAFFDGNGDGNVLLGAAAIVSEADIRNSILRREVVVEPGAQIEDCVIAPGAQIGYDHDRDHAAGYHVTEGGIVVAPLGDVRYFAREEYRSGSGYSE